MDLRELSKTLRAQADEIDAMVKTLVVPTCGHVSIPDAFGQLLVACERTHLSVQPPRVNYYPLKEQLVAEPWEVYIGTSKVTPQTVIGTFEGRTLDEAVQAAIAAYRAATDPASTEPDVAQAIVDVTKEFSDPPPL